MKSVLLVIQLTLFSFTIQVTASPCNCKINSAIILDDSTSVKRFIELIEKRCPEDKSAISIERSLSIQTANITDHTLSLIPGYFKVVSIGENLTIHLSKISRLPDFLSHLEQVGNTLQQHPTNIDIRHNNKLKSLNLNRYIGESQHNITISDNSGLVHFEVPKSIKTVNRLSISNNAKLKTLAPVGISSANSLIIRNNPKLEAINLTASSLAIHYHLRIEKNISPKFESLDISNITSYSENTIAEISILDNYFLKTLSGPSQAAKLTKVEKLVIQGNKENLSQDSPRLKNISGFSTISEITDQFVLSSTSCSSDDLVLTLGKQLMHVNDIYILDNNNITDLNWLTPLNTITGEIFIKFNQNLSHCNIRPICSHPIRNPQNISNNGVHCESIDKVLSLCRNTKITSTQ